MGDEDKGNVLFCGGLPQDCTDQELMGYFSQYGECTIDMKIDPATQRPRGFAFITFSDVNVIGGVLAGAANHTIRDKWVDVKQYSKGAGKGGKGGKGGEPADPSKAQTLFVGGLAGTVTDADLQAYFGQFGALTSAAVKIDFATSKSRGFGFVEYVDPSSVQGVLAQSASHTIHDKWVDVKVYGGGGKAKGKGKAMGGMGGGFGGGKGMAPAYPAQQAYGAMQQPAYSPYGQYGAQQQPAYGARPSPYGAYGAQPAYQQQAYGQPAYGQQQQRYAPY